MDIKEYLSNLSVESLMELSESSNCSSFDENSIVRKIVSDYKISDNIFTGVIGLRENILVEITKRYFGKLTI